MDEQQLSDLIDHKIRQWQAKQQGQTDGYEYERTFNDMMQNIGQEILQESIGKISTNKNLKKKSSPRLEK